MLALLLPTLPRASTHAAQLTHVCGTVVLLYAQCGVVYGTHKGMREATAAGAARLSNSALFPRTRFLLNDLALSPHSRIDLRTTALTCFQAWQGARLPAAWYVPSRALC